MNVKAGTKRLLYILVPVVLVALPVLGFMLSKGEQAKEQQREAPVPAPNRVSVVRGLTTVMLEPDVQKQSGIRVEPLVSTNHQTGIVAYGTVVDLLPLIDLGTRYASAVSDAKTARAAAAASEAEYNRNRALYADNQNVSLKAMEAAHAIYSADQAKVEVALMNARNLQAAARQQFGEPLGRWGLDPNSPQFQRFRDRQDVLLRITLPQDEHGAPPSAIYVTADSNQRVPASLVSPSPQTDPNIQGRAYLYRAAVPLASGTRIVAYLPDSHASMSGVWIPGSALVWYGGQPWAYVQSDNDHFQRRAVAQQSPSDGGFFVTQGFMHGERVVVSGAQLLLSEESRGQISAGGEHD